MAPESDAGSTGGSGAPPPDPGGPTPVGADAGAAAWAAWESRLVGLVLALADGEALTATAAEEGSRPVRRRRAPLRRLLPARHDVVAPWVRLERVEDHVRGHCVGSESFGGPFPWSPEEEDALVALGWRRQATGGGSDYVRYWPDDVPQAPFLPVPEAVSVAATVGATFRDVLGGEPGSGLPALARG